MKKDDIRIVFMGTPEFAVPSLKALINNNYNVVGVITAPDKEAGRGKKIRMSAVKNFAISNNLKVLQPNNLKNEDFINELRALNANLQIVVAFRMLPEIVWAMPKLGTFNLHASLLPQYRGAAPINFAIINGESVTGITTFFLDNKIDTGEIILQQKIKINNDEDAGSLHDKMMEQGAELLLKTVDVILENKIVLQKQDTLNNNQIINKAFKINKADCKINWNNDAITIHNFVRGLCPYPTAFTIMASANGIKHTVKIFKVKIYKHNELAKSAGTIVTNNNNQLYVQTKKDIIEILELQLSGKKRMFTKDFLRGFQNINDFTFE